MNLFGRCLLLPFSIFAIGAIAESRGHCQWLRPAVDPIGWETDYNTARKRAAAKGLPLFVVIGTEQCYYCRKLESGPLRDPQLTAHLQRHFVLLKIDAHREPELARALRVQAYPTIVLAGPDGKIHAFLEGYLDANRLEEHCKRTLLAISTADGPARDFEHASQALASNDYPRAISLLRQVAREAGEQPIGQKARKLLEEIERQAATQQQRAADLIAQGRAPEAVDVLGGVIRQYAGTQAAAQASEQLQRLTTTAEVQQQLRQRSARELLVAAREDFRQQRYYDCLLKCEQLQSYYAGESETEEAARLAAEIQKNPQYLARACEQLQQRTAELSLRLAEAWQAQGRLVEAVACYERVLRVAPESAQAQAAAAALGRLKAQGAGTPASQLGGGAPPVGTPTGMIKP